MPKAELQAVYLDTKNNQLLMHTEQSPLKPIWETDA